MPKIAVNCRFKVLNIDSEVITIHHNPPIKHEQHTSSLPQNHLLQSHTPIQEATPDPPPYETSTFDKETSVLV
jgi:hypothetical protein